MHKLLQYLPDIDAQQQEKLGKNFLEINGAEFTDNQRRLMLKEVLELIVNPVFAPLFGKGSKGEVPLMGNVG